MKLTQSIVDKLELPEGKTDHIFWDDANPGFGFRLRAGGSKRPVIQYKLGAKQRRMTTKPCTLEQARRWAKKELGRVANGEDPQGEKHVARATAHETFKAISERFIEFQTGRLRRSSLRDVDRYLTRYCKRLHELPIERISRRDVASMLATIATDHGPVSADRAASALSSMFAWAIGAGLVDANPVIGTNKHAGHRSRDRVLKDEELAAVWLAAGDDDFGNIIKLLMLTGQRRSEIADLQRSEIVGRNIELSAERCKNHRAHIVPLSAPAWAIIEEQLGNNLRPTYLFGAHRFSGFSGFSKSKRGLDARLEGVAPWTLHDIRRSVSTRMHELGTEPHIVEAILNHVSGHKSGVAGVYNRAVYLEGKAKALDAWANHISVIVAQASGANVSKLHKTRSGGLARPANLT
jgi:integrase